jgi:hypothetical protein
VSAALWAVRREIRLQEQASRRQTEIETVTRVLDELSTVDRSIMRLKPIMSLVLDRDSEMFKIQSQHAQRIGHQRQVV